MNIKGGAAGNVGFWSQHLMREKENDPDPNVNDRVTVLEISGLLSTTVEGALREMQAVASGSRSEGNFMYQANLNPQISERLKPEQLREAVDILAGELGFEGHQRVIVEHEKKGRLHGHVIFNRVDVDTLRVKDITGNYEAHERAAEKIEQKFGLERTPKPHLDLAAYQERRHNAKPLDISEIRAAQKTGIDPQQIKAELTDLWRKVDSGKAFTVAIEERGYILAQGDRRNFCILDHAGTAHSLARRIEGAKAKDINERLADIDRDKLPTVDAARDAQREKYPTKEQAQEAWHSRTGAADYAQQQQREAKPERGGASSEGKVPEDWHSRDATPMEEKIFHIQGAVERIGDDSLAIELNAEGIIIVRVDRGGKADVEREHGKSIEAKIGEVVAYTQSGEVHRLNPRFIDIEKLDLAARGNPLNFTVTLSEGRAHFIEMEQDIKDFARKAEQKQARAERQAEELPQDERWHKRDETKMEQKIQNIMDKVDRVDDPERPGGVTVAALLYAEGLTLARVDAKGKAAIESEYTRQFENAKLKDIREGTKEARLRHAPDEGELVAVTKWGDIHRLNPRFINLGLLENNAIDGGKTPTPTLSAAREFFATDRQQQKDDRQTARDTIKEAKQTQRDHDRTENAFKAAPGQAANKFVAAGCKGLDSAGKIASLGSFLESLFGMKAKPEPLTPQQQQQRAAEALEEIADSIERGDRLNPSDVANLLPIQLENLKRHGDAFMREMISDLDRYRDRDRGRERER